MFRLVQSIDDGDGSRLPLLSALALDPSSNRVIAAGRRLRAFSISAATSVSAGQQQKHQQEEEESDPEPVAGGVGRVGYPTSTPKKASSQDDLIGCWFSHGFQQLVAASSRAQVTVWDPLTGQQVYEFRAEHGRGARPVVLTAASLDHLGRRLLAGDHEGRMGVWNFNNGELLLLLPSIGTEVCCTLRLARAYIRCPLVAAGWQGELRAWPAKTRESDAEQQQQRMEGHGMHDVVCVAECGEWVVSGDVNGGVLFWHPDSRRLKKRQFLPSRQARLAQASRRRGITRRLNGWNGDEGVVVTALLCVERAQVLLAATDEGVVFLFSSLSGALLCTRAPQAKPPPTASAASRPAREAKRAVPQRREEAKVPPSTESAAASHADADYRSGRQHQRAVTHTPPRPSRSPQELPAESAKRSGGTALDDAPEKGGGIGEGGGKSSSNAIRSSSSSSRVDLISRFRSGDTEKSRGGGGGGGGNGTHGLAVRSGGRKGHTTTHTDKREGESEDEDEDEIQRYYNIFKAQEELLEEGHSQLQKEEEGEVGGEGWKVRGGSRMQRRLVLGLSNLFWGNERTDKIDEEGNLTRGVYHHDHSDDTLHAATKRTGESVDQDPSHPLLSDSIATNGGGGGATVSSIMRVPVARSHQALRRRSVTISFGMDGRPRTKDPSPGAPSGGGGGDSSSSSLANTIGVDTSGKAGGGPHPADAPTPPSPSPAVGSRAAMIASIRNEMAEILVRADADRAARLNGTFRSVGSRRMAGGMREGSGEEEEDGGAEGGDERVRRAGVAAASAAAVAGHAKLRPSAEAFPRSPLVGRKDGNGRLWGMFRTVAPAHAVTCMACDGEGKLLVIGDSRGWVQLHDISELNEEEAWTTPPLARWKVGDAAVGTVQVCDIDRSGRLLKAPGSDQKGSPQSEGHGGGNAGVAADQILRVISTTCGGRVRLWGLDASDLACLGQMCEWPHKLKPSQELADIQRQSGKLSIGPQLSSVWTDGAGDEGDPEGSARSRNRSFQGRKSVVRAETTLTSGSSSCGGTEGSDEKKDLIYPGRYSDTHPMYLPPSLSRDGGGRSLATSRALRRLAAENPTSLPTAAHAENNGSKASGVQANSQRVARLGLKIDQLERKLKEKKTRRSGGNSRHQHPPGWSSKRPLRYEGVPVASATTLHPSATY